MQSCGTSKGRERASERASVGGRERAERACAGRITSSIEFKYPPKETDIASSSHGLDQTGTLSSELSSGSALAALYISMATRTESESVDALTLPAAKYSHAPPKDTVDPPAVNGLARNPRHVGQLSQFLSCSNVMAV